MNRLQKLQEFLNLDLGMLSDDLQGIGEDSIGFPDSKSPFGVTPGRRYDLWTSDHLWGQR